jgi:hypothetical protein
MNSHGHEPSYSCPFVVPFLDKKRHYFTLRSLKILQTLWQIRYNFPVRAVFLFNAIKNNINGLECSNTSPCNAHNKLQASCKALSTVFLYSAFFYAIRNYTVLRLYIFNVSSLTKNASNFVYILLQNQLFSFVIGSQSLVLFQKMRIFLRLYPDDRLPSPAFVYIYWSTQYKILPLEDSLSTFKPLSSLCILHRKNHNKLKNYFLFKLNFFFLPSTI